MTLQQYTLRDEERLYRKVIGDPDAPAEATRPITVMAITLTFAIDKRWVRLGATAGDPVTFSGKLMYNTTPWADHIIHIGYFYGGKWNWIREATTGADGTFSLTTVLGFGEVLACLDYDWVAFAEKTYSPYVKLAVAYNTRIRALFAPSEVKPGESFVVRGYLERETVLDTWAPIPSATVSIYYNGTWLGDAVTGDDGYFEMVTSIPATGAYTLKASFAGADIPTGLLAPAEAVLQVGAEIMNYAFLIGALAPPLTIAAILIGNEVTKWK